MVFWLIIMDLSDPQLVLLIVIWKRSWVYCHYTKESPFLICRHSLFVDYFWHLWPILEQYLRTYLGDPQELFQCTYQQQHDFTQRCYFCLGLSTAVLQFSVFEFSIEKFLGGPRLLLIYIGITLSIIVDGSVSLLNSAFLNIVNTYIT